MSYDISLEIDTGRGVMHEVVDVGNYTSNVAAMFRRALPPDGLPGLHGRICSGVIELLREGVEEMEAAPNEYRALNPPNGWGNYEGALSYLTKLRNLAQQHPACTIYVSY